MRGRLFNMEDALYLERSRTIRELLKHKLAVFTAFDSQFDNTFLDKWLLAIEDCEAHTSHETAHDELSQLTSDTDEKRKACFETANGLKYYVGKAFRGDELMLEEFGFTERKKVRTKALSTVVWMFVLLDVASDYTTELTGAGMPASVLTDMATANGELGDAELKQEKFKRIIVRLFRQRKQKYEHLHWFYSITHKAAQVVFYNNETVRAQFNLE